LIPYGSETSFEYAIGLEKWMFTIGHQNFIEKDYLIGTWLTVGK
jgi:hypothetical protein